MEPTRDRDRIRAVLRRAPALHVYELGDLDDFFFPRTTWYARGDAIALVYAAPSGPVLAAFARPDEHAALAAVLAEIASALPPRLHAHLTPGLAEALAPAYATRACVDHVKMVLREPARVPVTAGVDRLGPADAGALAAFYTHAYPGNWFDPSMLSTGPYVAIREGGAIVAAAGIHVYSAAERVAALGNIATAPEARRRGLGAKVTAALCAVLRETTDVIGLNVRADNAAAIRCYEQLGFERVAAFDELVLARR